MARGLPIYGDEFRKIREQLFFTQNEIAQRLSMSPRGVQRIEQTYIVSILPRTFRALAELAKSSPEGLQARLVPSQKEVEEFKADKGEPPEAEDAAASPPEVKQKLERVEVKKYPVFDVAIPAGKWTDSDPREGRDADDWIELPLDTPDDAFCLRITGDCMEPTYRGGMILVFVPVRPGEEGAREFVDGKDYYFEHSDGKATFKRVFYEAAKERYRLECLNPRYKGFTVPEQMLARMSRVVKIVQVTLVE